MHKITLTIREISYAARNGVDRVMQTMEDGHGWTSNYNRDAKWDDSISGSLGELAAAKFLDKFPKGFGNRNEDDLSGWEVRTIKDSTRNLIVKLDEAKRDRNFLLVLNSMPDFYMVGWISTQDPEFKRIIPKSLSYSRPPVYLVDKSILKPFK